MNEQIFELAIKCGIIEMDQNGEDNTAAVQEFAELIVRECIGAVDIPAHLNGEAEYYFREAAQLIRNHFGVE